MLCNLWEYDPRRTMYYCDWIILMISALCCCDTNQIFQPNRPEPCVVYLQSDPLFYALLIYHFHPSDHRVCLAECPNALRLGKPFCHHGGKLFANSTWFPVNCAECECEDGWTGTDCSCGCPSFNLSLERKYCGRNMMMGMSLSQFAIDVVTLLARGYPENQVWCRSVAPWWLFILIFVMRAVSEVWTKHEMVWVRNTVVLHRHFHPTWRMSALLTRPP